MMINHATTIYRYFQFDDIYDVEYGQKKTVSSIIVGNHDMAFLHKFVYKVMNVEIYISI